MDLKDRIKEIERTEGLTREDLARKAGMKYTRLRNLVGGQTVFRMEDLEAISKIFPEYEYWLFCGKEIPEAGQISPMTKAAQRDLRTQGRV